MTKEFKEMKRATRLEVIRCAHTLLKTMNTWDELEELMAKGQINRLEYLTTKAVHKGNYKFIQWIVELSIGKAQTIDEIENPGVTIVLDKDKKIEDVEKIL